MKAWRAYLSKTHLLFLPVPHLCILFSYLHYGDSRENRVSNGVIEKFGPIYIAAILPESFMIFYN